MNTEILCWCLLGISVLMFICVIGFGGGIGNSFGDLLFGIMGTNAYVFPFLVFFLTLYLMVTHGNTVALIRTFSLIALFCVMCGVWQLIGYANMTGSSVADYFEVGQQYHTGGGAIGGALILFFQPTVGLVGTWAVFLISIFLFGALITQKALFVSTGIKGSEALEDRRTRNEELRLEREELRLEREERRREERLARQKEAEARREQKEREEALSKSTIQASPVFFSVLGKEDEATGSNKPVKQKKKKFTTDLFGDTKKSRWSKDEPPVLTPDQVVFGTAKMSDETPGGLVTNFSSDRAADPGQGLEEKAAGEQSAPDGLSTPPKAGKTKRTQGPSSTARSSESMFIRVGKISPENSPENDPARGVTTLPRDDEEEDDDLLPSFTIHRAGRSIQGSGDESRSDSAEGKVSPIRGLAKDTANPNTAKRAALKLEEVIEDDDYEEEAGPVVTSEDIEKAGVSRSGKKEEKKAAPEKMSKEETQTEVESVAKEIEENEEEDIPYEFPSLDLLEKPSRKNNDVADDEVRETARKLEQVLGTFGVHAKITDVSCGPSVTRYEFLPELGTKVSKITNLADDLKLNLAAADIRIEAPIPGKAAVGIEIPNKKTSMVYFRELIDSEEFRKNSSRKLSYAVGKDISGKIVVSDIAKMPHLLIAGATGSGKSVFINTLIMSIIYNADPSEVKMIMIDPKVVELSVYNGIPHLFIPVVTDPKKAAGALNWGVAEMTRRYQVFAEVGVRNLAGYNAKVDTLIQGGVPDAPKKMPQIVIIVDELADLMMVSGNEVEDAICRLAQLARACGIHLVIATQRPSVDVITGLIKANIPSRIAFAVSSGTDSRTILDMVGAEKLLGNGDMLFSPQTYKKPVRVQGAFISDEEIQRVVDEIRIEDSAQGQEVMKKRMQQIQAAAVTASGASGGGDTDELFAEAGRFIIQKDKASIGMLQRWFKIGFNRAARIMDQLSDAEVVGPEEGTKPRKVLMSAEQFENYLEQN